MAYFLVTASITDGEFEYWEKIPVAAKNIKQAIRQGLTNSKTWTQQDHRKVSLQSVRAIPKRHFQVLHKYL